MHEFHSQLKNQDKIEQAFYDIKAVNSKGKKTAAPSFFNIRLNKLKNQEQQNKMKELHKQTTVYNPN